LEEYYVRKKKMKKRTNWNSGTISNKSFHMKSIFIFKYNK
jgi:hypothetical protein